VFHLRNLLCAATLLGLMFSSPEAEARFGKRSKKDDKTHEASPVGSDDDDKDDDRGSHRDSGAASAVDAMAHLLFFVADVASASQNSAASTSSSEVRVVVPHGSQSNVRMGVDGNILGSGAGANLFLAAEGRRMGLDGRLMLMSLPTDDGTPGTDALAVGTVHFTYALVAHERLRLRLEGGIGFATAPDMAAAGPSIGLTLDAWLFGPFDLEMRAQTTPFPYQQLDFQAGLALHLNVLVLRGGWRGIYLNDSGFVDGVSHQDTLTGPYLGLGLTF
jgi:hypothetical protein